MSAYYLLIGAWTEVCERCHFLLFFPMRLLVAWFPALGSAEGCLLKESWWWGERGGSECLQWVTLSLWSSSWKHSSCCEHWAQPKLHMCGWMDVLPHLITCSCVSACGSAFWFISIHFVNSAVPGMEVIAKRCSSLFLGCEHLTIA